MFENVSVSVAAKTAEGWGPYSQLHFFTTLEDGKTKCVSFNALYKD